jgi:hypothetical protein
MSLGLDLAVRGVAPTVSRGDWPLLATMLVVGILLLVLRRRHMAFWNRLFGNQGRGQLYELMVFAGIPVFLIALGLAGFVLAFSR